jgi:hypothetical protein
LGSSKPQVSNAALIQTVVSTVAIKIECECGQHYAFDVEPVDGRMPTAVACPACGADGTLIANEIISRASEKPKVPTLTAVSVRTQAQQAQLPSTAQSRQAAGRRARLNDDETRDFIEAKHDIKRAVSAAVIVAGLDVVVLVLRLCGIPIPGVNVWILLDVAVVVGLAYGIYRFSRTCAILMLIYYLTVFISLFGKTRILGLVTRGVFLYFFGRGVQAMFTYHKLNKRMIGLVE